MLIGAVISSTDAASVFSILRSKRLNLKYHTASLLEVESGSNDPCSYMLTVIVLSILNGEASLGRIGYMVFAQLAYGAGFGVLTALFAIWVLKKVRFATEGFDTIFIFAAVLLSYAAPAALGGNGYLSSYIFGVIIGNRWLRNKKSLVHFFDGVTGLMQMLVFFLLGLLSFPSMLPRIVLPAVLIALFLTFFARPATIFMLLTPFGCKLNQLLLVSLAGLRGAASIVFAIMAVISPVTIGSDVFHIVFCIVLFSIIFQGSLLPYMSKKLNMIDEAANVLKTFNDYTEELPVQSIEFTIGPGHPWAERAVSEIILPPQTLLVQLQRGSDRITPDGNTLLYANDRLILSAKSSGNVPGISLTELPLDKAHEWVGQSVSSLPLEAGKLVVMIRRGDETIIPNGQTVLECNDTLVINQCD